jgi:hypothetical protein
MCFCGNKLPLSKGLLGGGRSRGMRGKGLQWNVIFKRRDKSQRSIITGKTRTDGRTYRRTFSCVRVVSHRGTHTLFFYGESTAKGATNWMLQEDTACAVIPAWYVTWRDVTWRVSGARSLDFGVFTYWYFYNVLISYSRHRYQLCFYFLVLFSHCQYLGQACSAFFCGAGNCAKMWSACGQREIKSE